MLRRHKILLGLLLEAPHEPSRTGLIKWLFLLREETCLKSESSFYDFVPYRYGPFSFTVYRDLEDLRRLGFLESEGLRISPLLLEQVREHVNSLPSSVKKAIQEVLCRFSSLSHDALVGYVYATYPWFASWKDVVASRAKSNPAKGRAVYTVGYEGRSIESFFCELMRVRITRILDVRSNPVSRKYGFSGKTLRSLCGKLDIEYVHLPELGIPGGLRTSLVSFDDYQKLMRKYERSILPKVHCVFQQASRFVEERSTALLCFESDVRCCHRDRLANAVAKETGMPIIHL